jgi:t-SNARE complex subunit (syntaxin)
MNKDQLLGEIKKETAGKYTLNELEKAVLKVLSKHAAERVNIGYVAGVLTSDGPEKIAENVEKLINTTNQIRNKHKDILIFSSTDIFNEKLVFALEDYKKDRHLLENKFHKFWENILSSGYVNDIFMTKGWERSKGAKHEYQVAKKNKLVIHL